MTPDASPVALEQLRLRFKTKLADELGHDRLAYTGAKTDFVTGVLRAAERRPGPPKGTRSRTA